MTVSHENFLETADVGKVNETYFGYLDDFIRLLCAVSFENFARFMIILKLHCDLVPTVCNSTNVLPLEAAYLGIFSNLRSLPSGSKMAIFTFSDA